MNRKTVLFIVIAIVLGIGLGVGGTIGVQKLFMKDPEAVPKAVAKEPGPLVPIGEFMVNLQGGSYLKVTMTIEGKEAKAEELLKSKEAFFKDKVNTVLSNKSLGDVQTPAAREKLRQELIDKLNEVGNGKVQNVLFLSFIYQ